MAIWGLVWETCFQRPGSSLGINKLNWCIMLKFVFGFSSPQKLGLQVRGNSGEILVCPCLKFPHR